MLLQTLTLDINIDGDRIRASYGVSCFTGVGARVFPGDGAEANLTLEAEHIILSLQLHCTRKARKDYKFVSISLSFSPHTH